MNDSTFSIPGPGRLWRFARKELRETLRDRRTIVTLVLMPLLLYPLMAVAFRTFFLSTGANAKERPFLIGCATEAESRMLGELLQLGDRALSQTRKSAKESPPLDERVRLFQTEEFEAALRKGQLDLGVRISNVKRNLDLLSPVECELIYMDDGSAPPLDALDFVQRRLLAANVTLFQARLSQREGRETQAPIRTSHRALEDPDRKAYGALATLLPLVLILMTITGAVYPAIDLTAGERERGTLEMLMAAPIPRVGLLLGKYVAVLAVASLTSAVNLVMMILTVTVSGLGSILFGDAGVSIATILAIAGLMLLFASFFSAVLLAVTSFARSFKEAQAYLIPLMLAAIAPGMVALLPGLKLGGPLTIVPLVNVVLLARELLTGVARFAPAMVVVISTLLYAAAAIAVAARIFGAEAVLYNDQGHWSDLFRRPATWRRVATPGAALACLAVMFPVHFLLSNALGLQAGLDLTVRYALVTLTTLLLFLGVPAVSAWWGRVAARSGFGLYRPTILATLGAVVLGLTCWPMVAEMALLLHRLGFNTMPKELSEQVTAAWRQLPPALILLATAIVPPIVEELTFRGFLFGAIENAGRPRSAIIATAALFALFHLLVGSALSLERLPPSFLMGLLLGWVRWRTGSVFAGMILHLIHNGLLVSAVLFPAAFGALGRVAVEEDHLPAWMLLASAAGGIAGAVIVGLGRRRN
jgi:ABC-2 type transport system permease protein/sodium transport system permease protein